MRPENLAASKRLVETLWGWSICTGCEYQTACPYNKCPATRFDRLRPFLRCFHSLCATHGVGERREAGNCSHEDVFSVVEHLMSNPGQTRSQVASSCFPNNPDPAPSPESQAQCIRIAVQSMLMLNCSSLHTSLDRLESGNFKLPWQSTQSLSDYVGKQLPKHDHPIFSNADIKCRQGSHKIGDSCKSGRHCTPTVQKYRRRQSALVVRPKTSYRGCLSPHLLPQRVSPGD